jgi:hypothetical protein
MSANSGRQKLLFFRQFLEKPTEIISADENILFYCSDIYLMTHKSKSFEKLKEFQNELQNQLGKTIKFLRSDHGGGYLSLEFSDHLKQCGIVPPLTLII